MSHTGAFVGPGLALRTLRVADRDAVLLRSILEAYDGLASFYGDGSGLVTLTVPVSRAEELDALIDDLVREGLSMTPVESALF